MFLYLALLYMLPSNASLTLYGSLSSDVIEEFGVVGKHSTTGWTCHQLLLSVTPHVLP